MKERIAQLEAENEALRTRVRDYEDDCRAVMEERCDDDRQHCTCVPALRKEIARLERRFLEETAAHDKTRHRLECRERELERIRSNNYSERVERMRGAP